VRAGNESEFVFFPNLLACRTVQTAFLTIGLDPAAKRFLECDKALGFPFSANFPFPLLTTIVGSEGIGLQVAVYLNRVLALLILKENLYHV